MILKYDSLRHVAQIIWNGLFWVMQGIENPEAYVLYTSGGGVLSSASALESLGISEGDILYLGYKGEYHTKNNRLMRFPSI